MPSWWQAPLGDEAPEAFVIETVNLGGERESLFLGGFLIFVWSAPHGLVVVRIHNNHNPPTIVIIASNADLDGVLLHVGFIQVQFGPASGAATRVGRQTFRGSMAASSRPDREAASSASGPGTRVVALAQRYRCSGAPGAPDDPSPRRGCRPPVRAVVCARGPRDRALVMPVASQLRAVGAARSPRSAFSENSCL